MGDLAGKGQGKIILENDVITVVNYEIIHLYNDSAGHPDYEGTFTILDDYEGFTKEINGLELELIEGRKKKITLFTYRPKIIKNRYKFKFSPQ